MELSQEQVSQLQDLLKKQEASTNPVAQPTTQSQEFQIRVGEQNYIVRNQDEAQRLFDQYEAQQAQALEAERVKSLALEQRQQQFQAQPQSQRQTGTDGFDKEEYARLFLEDPRKANRYALQHDSEQLRFYQGLVSEMTGIKQEAAASQFLLQHRDDYVPTDDNFKAINGIMSQYTLPWTLQGMNLAFQVAKAQGQLEQPEAQTQKQVRYATPPQTQAEEGEEEQAFTAAPRLRRRSGGAGEEDIAERFSQLGPAEQKKYLESLLPTR